MSEYAVCPSVRHWAYVTTFAVEVRFQIRDHFGFRVKNDTGHVTCIFCKTSIHSHLTSHRILVFSSILGTLSALWDHN